MTDYDTEVRRLREERREPDGCRHWIAHGIPGEAGRWCSRKANPKSASGYCTQHMTGGLDGTFLDHGRRG